MLGQGAHHCICIRLQQLFSVAGITEETMLILYADVVCGLPRCGLLLREHWDGLKRHPPGAAGLLRASMVDSQQSVLRERAQQPTDY